MIIRPKKLWRRIRQALEFELKPELRFIGSAIQRALQDRFAPEDSESKSAIVLGRSLWLVQVLGLKKTRILHLPYPDFTVENLALLSDEYDFVIADRVLHRCRSVEDAACETIRVLKPGGWFVHTTTLFDLDTRSSLDWRRSRPARLEALFPALRPHLVGSWGRLAGHSLVSWVVGQKASSAPDLVPTVATRKSPWRHYPFKPRRAKFGVVAVMRNEAPYLLEWIAYYRLLGFGQITIYDNQSNDASERILTPLARAGIINAKFWTDRPTKQRRAYTNAIRKLRPFVEWCLFADFDEFLILDPGLSLVDLLPKEPDIIGVAIPWRMYGSAGLRNRSPDLTIERFTKAAPTNANLVKSLIRLRDVKLMSIHIPKVFTGHLVDIAGTEVNPDCRGILPTPAHGPARINHYFNRSWEEFTCKRARGRGAKVGGFHGESAFDRVGTGEVDLPDAVRFAPAVKEEVARLRRIVEGTARSSDRP